MLKRTAGNRATVAQVNTMHQTTTVIKKLVTRNTTTEGDGNSDMMVKESKQERQ